MYTCILIVPIKKNYEKDHY